MEEKLHRNSMSVEKTCLALFSRCSSIAFELVSAEPKESAKEQACQYL